MCALRTEVDSVLSANPGAPSSAEHHPSPSRSGTVAVESASVEERRGDQPRASAEGS